MKKVVFTKLLVLVLVLVLSTSFLVGCQSTEPEAAEAPAEEPAMDDAAEMPAMDAPESIKIGWVMPLTGALAQFSSSSMVVKEWAESLINDEMGGVYMEAYGTNVPVEIIIYDCESNDTKASEQANNLILKEEVDLLIGQFTPGTTLPVSAVGEKNQVPTLVLDSPDGSWLGKDLFTGENSNSYEWTYACLFDLYTMIDHVYMAWDEFDTNKKVGLLYDQTPDGLIGDYLAAKAVENGYTVVDTPGGKFPDMTDDFSAIIDTFKTEEVEIIACNVIGPTFGAMITQFYDKGFVPKVYSVGKAVMFDADLENLGMNGDIQLGDGLLTELHWDRSFPYTSPLFGWTSDEVADKWEAEQGTRVPATIGWDLIAWEIINDVFGRTASMDKEDIKAALAATDIQSSKGHLMFDEEHAARVTISYGQWRATEGGVVEGGLSDGDFWKWENLIMYCSEETAETVDSSELIFLKGAE